MIQVIENFLPADEFKKLRDELLSPEFPWYITPDVAFGHKDNQPHVERCDDIYNWQLIHNFYNTPGTMSEAIKLMNDSPFGLTASVWTQDISRAEEIANQIETGTVFMNRADYLDPALCWTGIKDTGKGGALSEIGYHNLTRPKSFHLKI